jgi:hypothetical protein
MRPVPSHVWCLCRVTKVTARKLHGEITLLDDSGRTVAQIEGFCAQALPQTAGPFPGDAIDEWLYTYEWRPAPPRAAVDARENLRGDWMIVSDDTRFGDDVEVSLTAQGVSCFQVRHGSVFTKEQPNTYRMLLDSKEDWARLFKGRNEAPIRGIAYLGGIEQSLAEDDPTGIKTCIVALRLLQELAEQDDETKPRLFIVTRRVHRIGEDAEVRSPQQHALWGLGRVIMNEHPEFRCALIDFDDNYDYAQMDALAA